MFNKINKLKEYISKEIKIRGPISFRDYMELCLYQDDFGYYSQRNFPVGKDGDFVTSPHASRLFGCLLSVQVKECFENITYQYDLNICEIGAGSGILAKDILEYFKNFEPSIFNQLKYIIIEPIQRRKEVLREILSEYLDHIVILNALKDIYEFKGVIIANELLDAFPVHVIERNSKGIFEIFVDEKEGKFFEIRKEITNKRLLDYIRRNLSDIPEGYRTEVNLEIFDWIRDLSAVLKEGYVIIIDYGFSKEEYYAPYRNRGTLLGYSRHQTTEDFYKMPGLIDMTAHVNFSDVIEAFESEGFFCEGLTPQWAFLGGLDFERTVKKVLGEINPFSPELAGIKALIFPQGMGETHKVFMASKNIKKRIPLKGFSIKNMLNNQLR